MNDCCPPALPTQVATTLNNQASNSGAALFSVVIPTYDDRGVLLHAVESWLAQRTEATPFELIIVDSGSSRVAQEVAQRLGSRDQFVSLKSSNEASLYNFGARRATSDWIVFSEAHVVPSRDMVAKLYRRLHSTRCDAAVLGSTHRTRTRLARVDASLFDRENSSLRALGLWRMVGLRGFLIRRKVFHALGTFNEAYLRFAETALAIGLVESGYQLEEFPEVITEHYDTDSFRELLVAMAAGRLGAHRFWTAEPKLALNYFHSHHPAQPLITVSIGLARSVGYQLLRSTCQRKWRMAIHMLRLIESTLVPAVFGCKIETWISTAQAWSTYLRLAAAMSLSSTPKQNCEPFLDLYRSLREKCAEIGSIRYRLESEQNRKPGQHSLPHVVEAQELQHCGLNFYPTEIYENERYSWSFPHAAIRVVLDSNDCLISLDARPTGGWLVRTPKLFINGDPIPRENITEEGGMVKVLIRSDPRRGLGPAILSWRCKPFRPADSGLPDSRSLGIALIRANVSQVASQTSLLPKSQAA